MERAEALQLLPPQYGAALRLADAGASEQAIAEALEIEPATIGPLLKIAEAKLQRILAGAEPGGGHDTDRW